MVYLFLADGFEDIEAIATYDILKRAGIDVYTVSVFGRIMESCHGTDICSDLLEDEVFLSDETEGIILPGGMPGTEHLKLSDIVMESICYCVAHDKYICAICAAPSILGELNLLEGKKATCYPGFEKSLKGADVQDCNVCTDGKFITAKSAGCTFDFAFEIVSQLRSPELAQKIAKEMLT